MRKKINIFILASIFILGAFMLISCSKNVTYTFETNGGSKVEAVQTKNGLASSPITTQEGYKFLGWYDNANYSSNPIVFPFKSKKSITLYAKWEAIIVTFETFGGSAVNPTVGKIEYEPITVRGGYQFAGWFADEQCLGNRIIFPFVPTSSCKLYAKWESVSAHTVTFKTYGGLPIAPMVATVIETSPETYLAGDVFLGWYLDEDFQNKVEFPYTVTEDVTFHAKWQNAGVIEKYTVEFVTNGGTPVEDFVGTVIETSPSTTKDNADFVGWFLDRECTRQARFPLELTDDITLYAKWEAHQDISPSEVETLRRYLEKSYTNYSRSLDQTVSDANGVIFRGVNNYYINKNAIYFIYPAIGEDGEYLKNDDGDYIYLREFVFYDEELDEYHYYYEDSTGKYPYDGRLYDVYVSSDPYSDGPAGEGILDALFLEKLSTLDPNNFYHYDGKWYVKDASVNELAKIILGDSDYSTEVGNDFEAQVENFTSFILTFDANGNLTNVDATSEMSYYSGGVSTGVLEYKYYLNYHFTIENINNVVEMNEKEMFEFNETPSGLYPVLDDENAYRKAFEVDETVYSVSDLVTALANLNNYKAFYTFATNRLTQNILYQEQLIHVRGNIGRIDLVGSDQKAYYYYDPLTNATFFINGSTIICDQYSYKNTYEYNQYLLPEDFLAYNVKSPTSNLSVLDPDKFEYDETEHCFKFVGSKREMLALGQYIFGNNDFDLPPYFEKENYNYIKIYLNDHKVSKVVAATYLDIYDGDIYTPYVTEYSLKELIITNEQPDSFELPVNENTLYVPGAAKENGSLDNLLAAIAKMGVNYTYQDTFCYVEDDELTTIDDDIYVYDGAKAKITSNSFYFYKDGVPYVYYASLNQIEKADDLWIDWGTPLLKLMDPNWFYEGKDGNYYCKEEYLEECSQVLSRYSGSVYMFPNQTSTYTKKIHLNFIKLSVSSSGISSIYYSGVLTTTGTNGSYDEIFSGIGRFSSIGSSSVTLPTSVTDYDTTYPDVVKRTLATPTEFSVSNEAVLSITPVKNATSYLAHVYLNGVEVENSPFTVNDGTSFKDLLTDGTYTLKLVAVGDGVHYLNSDESSTIEFVVSKFTKFAAPESYEIDLQNKKITFSPVANATRYVYQIFKDNGLVTSGELTETMLDFASLGAGRYVIHIYAAGDNVNYRDGDELIINHEVVEEGALSDIEEIFAVLNGSFTIKNASTLNCVINNHKYAYSYTYTYDAGTNRGKLVAKVIDQDNPDSDYSNPDRLVTIYYYNENGVDKAKIVIKEINKEITEETLSNVSKPFSKFNEIEIEDLKEVFAGKATEYYLENNSLDSYFENMSILEEVFYGFNVSFDYTELTFKHNNWNNPNEDMRVDITGNFDDETSAKQNYYIIASSDNSLANDENFNA